MDFAPFDKRGYRTLSVRDGYGEWAKTYEQTVVDLLDRRLLERLTSVDWPKVRRALDLACGTGRGGVWLKQRRVRALDGVDFTEEMLVQARARNVYDRLMLGDVADTKLPSEDYDLVTQLLADEHLSELGGVYREAARLLAPGGSFVLVGYHSHFLMLGVITHFDRAPGDPVAIESHVHLMSDHVRAAKAAGFTFSEMEEGLIDDAWIAKKPKWEIYRQHPVSFVFVWRKT